MAEEQKFPVQVPVETNADEAADSVEALRDAITAGTAEIRAMQGTMKQLRGSTDEVTNAKKQLETRIAAIKNKVSASTLALVKQGTTYDAAAARTKKLAEEQKKLAAESQKDQKAMGNAIKAAGGPVAALKERLSALKEVLGESSSGMGLLSVAAAGAAAAVVAITAAVAAGVVALGAFVLKAADAARVLQLDREAWSGTAANAKNLGTQVDALAAKIPIPKAKINELATALMGMRIPGGATVDVLNAVGQASAALGDEAGGKIKDFLTRFRQIGRVQINPMEMIEGFGNLDFGDVAKALAKQMGISVEAARKALAQGRLKLEDGAKAMRAAIEEKFGGLNLRKMLTFENMVTKIREKLAGLTADVDLEPLLKPLGELTKLFDSSTVTGQSLKLLVTQFGKGMVDVLVRGIPLAKAFFEGMVIGALEIYIGFLQVRKAWRDTFGESSLKDVDGVRIALEAGKIAVVAIAAAVVATGAAIALVAAPFVLLYAALVKINEVTSDLGKSARKFFLETDWSATGTAIVDGLIEGLETGSVRVAQTVADLGTKIKDGFKGALGIHSPSTVFQEYGRNTTEGYEKGVSDGAPGAQKATSDLGAAAPSSPAARAAGGGSAPVIHLHFNVSGGRGEETAKALSSPSFLRLLTKAVQDALAQGGNPVLT